MRKLILLFAMCLSASAAHVQFDFADLTATRLTNRVLMIIPTNSTPRVNGNAIVTSDRRIFTNGTSSLIVSNMVTSTYHCVLKGPFSDSMFELAIPETNVLIKAKDYLVHICCLQSNLAPVTFEFSDFVAEPLASRLLTVEGTNATIPRANGEYIISRDRLMRTNDGSGTVTIPMVPAIYHCVIRGPFKDTVFQITVPATNIALNASDLITVPTNALVSASTSTNPPGAVAYSMAASDALFVKKLSSWSTNQILTNALFAGGTNAFRFVGGSSGQVLGTDDGTNWFPKAVAATGNFQPASANLTNYSGAPTSTWARITDLNSVSNSVVSQLQTNQPLDGYTLFYTYDSGTPPSAGKLFIFENCGAFVVDINETDGNGFDVHKALNEIKLFDRVRIFAMTNKSIFLLGELAQSASDQGSYWEFVADGNTSDLHGTFEAGSQLGVSFGGPASESILSGASSTSLAQTTIASNALQSQLNLTLTNTINDGLSASQIAITNGTVTQKARFKSLQPGSGILLTNEGTNVVFAWDHTMTNGLATTAYADTAGVRGFNLQSNAFGGTVGGATNLMVLPSTNMTVNATNTTSGGGTNSIKFDTIQPIATQSSPTFSNLTISGTFAAPGFVKGISVQTNDFGGTSGSATNLAFFASTNMQVYGTNTASGNGTNSLSYDTIQPIKTNSSPQFLNAMIHQDLALPKTADARTGLKSRAWIITNGPSGYGDWRTITPMGTRKQWGWVVGHGNAIATYGMFDAASIGSGTQVAATTNFWTGFSYTSASATVSNGIYGNAQMTCFPGKNLYFSTLLNVTAPTNSAMWAGLTSGTPANMGNTDSPTTLSVAMWRLSSSAAETNWNLVTCDGSACTATAAPASYSTTNDHVLEIQEDITSNKWYGYIDGACVATNQANAPIAAMQYMLIITPRSASITKTFRAQGIYVDQESRRDNNVISYTP